MFIQNTEVKPRDMTQAWLSENGLEGTSASFIAVNL